MNSLTSKRHKILLTEKVCKNLKGQVFVEFCKERILRDEKVLETNHGQAGSFLFTKIC